MKKTLISLSVTPHLWLFLGLFYSSRD